MKERAERSDDTPGKQPVNIQPLSCLPQPDELLVPLAKHSKFIATRLYFPHFPQCPAPAPLLARFAPLLRMLLLA